MGLFHEEEEALFSRSGREDSPCARKFLLVLTGCWGTPMYWRGLIPWSIVILLSTVFYAVGDGVLQSDRTGGDESVQELEHLLWDAAIDSSQPQHVKFRAAWSLARLWQDDDTDAMCHVTAILANLGFTNGAAAVCRRAFRVNPQEPCAIFCNLHFALWTCDFDTVEALRGRATAAVESAIAVGPGGVPAGLGHLEALLVLPDNIFSCHLHQQLQYMCAASGGCPKLPKPTGAILAHQMGKRPGGASGRKLAVAVLIAHARQHAHGLALLAALRGLAALGETHIPLGFHSSPRAVAVD